MPRLVAYLLVFLALGVWAAFAVYLALHVPLWVWVPPMLLLGWLLGRALFVGRGEVRA